MWQWLVAESQQLYNHSMFGSCTAKTALSCFRVSVIDLIRIKVGNTMYMSDSQLLAATAFATFDMEQFFDNFEFIWI